MNTHRLFLLSFFCGIALLLFSTLTFQSCKGDAKVESDTTTTTPLAIPSFNRDSAYLFVEQQLSFGVRNPGSPGIVACRDWMVAKLEGYGAKVTRQKFQAKIYTGKVFPSENIIAQFNPESKNRILLGAHYDTRFIAEEDPDPAKQTLPIPGADDGGSGVGVLMEIARLVSENKMNMGVDIVFFDAEDQGTRDNTADPDNTSWCIGAQYWSKNLVPSGYKPRFGILVDMVGAKNAFFSKQNVTNVYSHADSVHKLYNKVWNLARAMGKGQYFQEHTIGGIIDDHHFVNLYAGITMIDIINKPPDAIEGFGPHWHTHQDDINVIDKNTLAAVGQVVTAVVYRTATGNF